MYMLLLQQVLQDVDRLHTHFITCPPHRCPTAPTQLPQLQEALRGVDEWQFDAFKLDAVSQGRPLSCLAFHLMTRMDLVKMFHLDKDKMIRYAIDLD